MYEYENQKEIEDLQKVVATLAPDIKLREFSVCGNRALSAWVEIEQKGNKATIDKLISLGFRKVSRYKKPLPFNVPLTTKDTFIIKLKKDL